MLASNDICRLNRCLVFTGYRGGGFDEVLPELDGHAAGKQKC